MSQIVKLGDEGKLGSIGNKSKEPYEEMNKESLGALTIWLYLFLMYIPFAGWIISFIFAFSKKGNLIRKNIAQATIINKAILLVIILAIYFVVSRFLGVVVGKLEDLVNLLEVVPNDASKVLEYISDVKQQLQEIIYFFK